METATIPGKTYFCYSERTTLNDLHEVAARETNKFMTEAQRLKLEPTGPLEFIYIDCTNDKNKSFTLVMALPVKEAKSIGEGKYSIKNFEALKCVKHTYKGSFSNIYQEYENLFEEIFSKGIKPTNQVREVYHQFTTIDSPENITEIQVGIQ